MNNINWAFNEATRLAPCPECDAEPGDVCTEDERDTATPHHARLKAYINMIGEAENRAKHGMYYGRRPEGRTR